MNYAELAEKIDAADVEGFAWLLGLEFAHDDEAADAKAMIVDALRHAASVVRTSKLDGANA